MDENFTFYGITWPHTRLQRNCCECGLQIERGERYQRLSGLYEGEWHNYSTCADCAKVREEFCSEFTMMNLYDDLMDLRDELSYDDVRTWALLTNALAGLRQRMQAARHYTGPALTPTHCFATRKS